MTAAVDWTPLVADGVDPIPGDAPALQDLGAHYGRVAEAVRASADALRALAGHDDMQSEAVEAVRTKAGEVADQVSRAVEHYARSGRALENYAPELEEAQRQARSALDEAEEARRRAGAADGQLGDIGDRIAATPPGVDTAGLETDRFRARAAATAADAALAAAQRRLADAVALRDDAVRRTVAEMTEAREESGLEDSVLDDVAEVVEPLVKVLDWVALVAGTLALLVGWIPLVGQALAAILGTVAAVAGLASLLGNLLLYANGDADLSDVVLAAVGAATFGLGKLASGALKVSARGVRGAARLSAGRLESGSAGIARRALTSYRESTGVSRDQARRLTRASRDQARLLSWSRLHETTAGVPREIVDSVRTVRGADYREVWRRVRTGPSGHDPDAARWLRRMGEEATGNEVARVGAMPAEVAASSEVAAHQHALGVERRVFVGAFTYGVFDVVGVQGAYGQGYKGSLPDPHEVLGLRPPEPAR